MISERIARKWGIKFFKEERCPELVKRIERGYCLNSIFKRAIGSLGKSKVLALYNKLPKQLRTYVLLVLWDTGEEHSTDSFERFYDEFEPVVESSRPERMKRFPECREKAEKILLKYLTRR